VFEELDPAERVTAVAAIYAARGEFDVRGGGKRRGSGTLKAASVLEADGETRTPDPIITSDVLYQLSYVGRGLLSRTRV
jgi:hypothetical protein